MLIKQSHQAGFTVVEALVAAAVFVTALLLAVDLFMVFLRESYHQAQQQQLEQNVLYLYQQFSTHLRTTPIDYAAYGGTITNPQSILYLRNQFGEADQLLLGDGTPEHGNLGQLYIYDANTDTVAPITPDPISAVYVDAVRFFIYPATDPFTNSANPANNQPAVLMWLEVHSASDSNIRLTYQALVTSRLYER